MIYRLCIIFMQCNLREYAIRRTFEMPVKVFLAVKVKSGKAKEVQKNLRAIDEVTLACSVSDGLYDVVAMVEVPNLDEYRTFSIDKVSAVPNISDYTSFIIMDQ
jgi:DNA-binding Lrp family transcriptional regulator